jgi:hypothetical protein
MAKPSKTRKSDPIPDDVLDRLYGAAPAEFVAHRDAAARELRDAGDRAAADAVRALRRPSAPAAAINRAVRAEPAQARTLLDAAGDLRRAHEAVLGGDADPDALNAAAAAERQAVNSLAATAAANATGGRPPSADVERRIRDTLEAVALDPDVRERFAAGRLEKDARAAGLATDVSVAAGRSQPRKRRGDDQAKRKAERELHKLEDAARRAEDKLERRRRDAAAAEVARERADATLREARERLDEAEADLQRASRAAERHRASAAR